MTGIALGLLLALLLLPLALLLALYVSLTQGAWRLSRLLGHAAPFLLGPRHGRDVAFQCAAFALRETGRIDEAVALVTAQLGDEDLSAWSRNVAIDVLISAGAYEAALRAEARPDGPASSREELGLAMGQINLAEAEYNLGRWEAAEARLRPLDRACRRHPMTRAGLLQQRAWIAAHRGRADEALALVGSIKPRWLPPTYRAELHFTRAVALLAAGRLDEAEQAVIEGERRARRRSSRRNGLFLRARVAAARGDWAGAERLCREAASHAFRRQGGDGLRLWARALTHLGEHARAEEARRLAAERDPESDSGTS
jgi:tetratricopeptide (TPR) repeat protein